MDTSTLGEWHRDPRDQHRFPNRDGGPKIIRFESPRWRPKSSSSSSRSPGAAHTKNDESILGVLYMDGNIISRSFQWSRFQAQICFESTGIVETRGRLEYVTVLRHHLLGCWPTYHVGVHYGEGFVSSSFPHKTEIDSL